MNKEIFNTTAFNFILVVVFGIVISYVDLHSDEVQPAVFLLLLFSFILGYKHPQKAWLYSLMLGLSIFIGYIIAKLIGFAPKGPPPDHIAWSFLPLIPAFVGGYMGVLVRFVLNKVTS